MKKKRYEFEEGDLVIEKMGDSYYLILLTKVISNYGEGWVIDEADIHEQEIYHNTPFYTKEEEDSKIELWENCIVLIQSLREIR